MTQRHPTVLTAFACGLLFGIGLVISGMTDPARIRAFLDVTGDWNPSLALVMIGAIATAAPFFAYARRREGDGGGDGGGGQEGRRIEAQLVIGATIFGIGWGLPESVRGPPSSISSPRRSRSCCCWSQWEAGSRCRAGSAYGDRRRPRHARLFQCAV
ncbi:hypothetical protein MOP88_19590 [Sphingomonas sp. WKB10]|nr:hypothetical protein [Sphingomonas sp. WKB10]